VELSPGIWYRVREPTVSLVASPPEALQPSDPPLAPTDPSLHHLWPAPPAAAPPPLGGGRVSDACHVICHTVSRYYALPATTSAAL